MRYDQEYHERYLLCAALLALHMREWLEMRMGMGRAASILKVRIQEILTITIVSDHDRDDGG